MSFTIIKLGHCSVKFCCGFFTTKGKMMRSYCHVVYGATYCMNDRIILKIYDQNADLLYHEYL